MYSGYKGLGIRAFCKAASRDKGWGLGPQLVACRNFQGPQIVTNPIIGSHSESKDGFVEADAGLRDAGSIEFDANFVPEYAQWQNLNDQYIQNENGTLTPTSFMSGLFGVSGQDFNRRGNQLEDPSAHQYDFYLALPNMLTLFHCFGYPSTMGPVIMAMESIVMSQFGFKISGAPSMMRPLATVHYTSDIASGLVASSKVVGTPVVKAQTVGSTPTNIPAVEPLIGFAADTINTYGDLTVGFTKQIIGLLSNYYSSPAGSYLLRLVYPGRYEVFSDIKKYVNKAGEQEVALEFGGDDWPSVKVETAGYNDDILAFRKIMGNYQATRLKDWYLILYRCDWLDA